MSMYLKMSVSKGYQDFESDNFILLSIINFKGFTAPIILVPREYFTLWDIGLTNMLIQSGKQKKLCPLHCISKFNLNRFALS